MITSIAKAESRFDVKVETPFAIMEEERSITI